LRQYQVIPRVYELMIILNPDVTDEELEPALDEVTRYVEDAGATLDALNTTSPWGRRRLAYSIRFNGRDVRDGYYALYHFTSDPSQVIEVERELKLDTRVMRYIVTRSSAEAAEANKPTPEPEPDPAAEPTAPNATGDVITPTAATVPVVSGDVSGTEDTPEDPALARSDEPMPTAEADPTDTSVDVPGAVTAAETATGPEAAGETETAALAAEETAPESVAAAPAESEDAGEPTTGDPATTDSPEEA